MSGGTHGSSAECPGGYYTWEDRQHSDTEIFNCSQRVTGADPGVGNTGHPLRHLMMDDNNAKANNNGSFIRSYCNNC